jgi:hypothetical protein
VEEEEEEEEEEEKEVCPNTRHCQVEAVGKGE